jgi:hypothetical protein
MRDSPNVGRSFREGGTGSVGIDPYGDGGSVSASKDLAKSSVSGGRRSFLVANVQLERYQSLSRQAATGTVTGRARKFKRQQWSAAEARLNSIRPLFHGVRPECHI